MKYVYKFESDIFEPGCCHECPLSYQDEDYDDICVLMRYYEDCPIREEEGVKHDV